jgi:multiple sugar transport system substrate-binding protein
MVDPDLNLEGFFPILLDAFGTWNDVIYGYPVDNYGGLMYYNQCMLEDAGFDGPPETWAELMDEYAPALTNTEEGQYGFALQSARGETQSADSFMRVVWPFGGSLLTEDFEPNLSSEASLAGLQFRQDLMQYMPPDIVQWNHTETVQGMARGDVAMITEWSSFYTTLADPESSDIVDCLGVTVEPAGPENQVAALGGFSFGINADSTPEQQAAAYLYIQWLTSEEMARPYVEAGGIPARMSVYEDEELQEQFPYFEPLVQTWSEYTVPEYRPRFPEWPQISEVISQWGADMMLGNVSVEEGVSNIESEMQEILEPYIEGDKERIQ